jgi:hypothetical protein
MAEKMGDEGDDKVKNSKKQRTGDPEDGGKRDKEEDRDGNLRTSRGAEPEGPEEESRDDRKDHTPSGEIRSGDGLVLPAKDEDEEDEKGSKDVSGPEPPEFRDHPCPEGSHASGYRRL